ncbi:MAG: hypothetical protein ACR2NX_16515 [Chthoniobacterales bacterium]
MIDQKMFASFTEYSFSWWTFASLVVYFLLATAVYRRIRDRHPGLHERLGGRRALFSASEQLRFCGFLFGLRYFRERDTTLSVLASLMVVTSIITIFLIFTQPIRYSWHS